MSGQKTIKLVKTCYWLSSWLQLHRLLEAVTKMLSHCNMPQWYRVCRPNCSIIVCISSWLLLNRPEPGHSLSTPDWHCLIIITHIITSHSYNQFNIYTKVMLVPSQSDNKILHALWWVDTGWSRDVELNQEHPVVMMSSIRTLNIVSSQLSMLRYPWLPAGVLQHPPLKNGTNMKLSTENTVRFLLASTVHKHLR